MKRFLLKFAILVIILNLPSAGLTNALLVDTETSSANTITASSLDFSLDSPDDFSPDTLTPGDSSTRSISIVNNGSLDFQYSIQAVKTGGNDDFCNALKFEATLDGISQYSDSLLAFSLSPTVISGDQDDWQFIVSLNNDDPNLQNKFCHFNLIFNGEQIGGGGFTDQEILANNLQASDWTAPVISNVNYLIVTPGESNELKAIITWDTDEISDSFVDYGFTISYGNSVEQADSTTSHSAEILGLSENRTYHFRVKSKDTYGNEAMSEDYIFETSHAHWDIGHSQIVINEFLPNPIGNDSASIPSGEWVELYNRSNDEIDVSGWVLTDSFFRFKGQGLEITNSNTNAENTIVPAKGFLVVYLNGTYSDWLSNNIDIISLWKPIKWGHWQWWGRIDDYLYGILGEEIIENKSFARIPDGSNNWYDPIPTPGRPNKMGETPSSWSNLPNYEQENQIPDVDFFFKKGKTAVGFRIINISQYSNLDYQILYETSGIEKGLGSTITLGGENEISRNGLVLGTCSKGVCVYDKGMAEIRLNIKLTNKDGKEISLDKSIKL
ncbi:MAG: lamin tail domain-containing protein [Candidatus Hodarchaeales archaeon]